MRRSPRFLEAGAPTFSNIQTNISAYSPYPFAISRTSINYVPVRQYVVGSPWTDTVARRLDILWQDTAVTPPVFSGPPVQTVESSANFGSCGITYNWNVFEHAIVHNYVP